MTWPHPVMRFVKWFIWQAQNDLENFSVCSTFSHSQCPQFFSLSIQEGSKFSLKWKWPNHSNTLQISRFFTWVSFIIFREQINQVMFIIFTLWAENYLNNLLTFNIAQIKKPVSFLTPWVKYIEINILHCKELHFDELNVAGIENMTLLWCFWLFK